MLDKHKISTEQRMLEKIVFSDMYSALLENDKVMVSCPKEQDRLIDELSRTEGLEASSYIVHKNNECSKIELLVTEIESLREQVKAHKHYVQNLENSMKITVDELIGKTQKIWEQNEVQMVKVNLNHQRLNDMDLWIKSGLQNTVKQIEATNLFVDQVNAKVVSDAEHIEEIYEILKTEELRKNSKINVRMQLLKDLHEQLKLNKQNIKSMHDVLKGGGGGEEAVADITTEKNSTELNKYLAEIRRLLVDETELNYNSEVNTLQEINGDVDHTVKEQQDIMVKELYNTVEEKENNVKGQQDNIVKEQQNNTVKEQQDNIAKQDNTVKEQQNTMIKEQQYNTAKVQQDNNVKEKKNNTVKDLKDNMVKELEDNLLKEKQDNTVKEQDYMAKEQHDDTLKEKPNNTVKELLDNVKEKKNLEISKMTTGVQAPNKTVKEDNASKNKLINSDKSFENMLLQDADKIIEFGNRNELLQSLKNINMKNTEKNNEIANIEKEIEKLQSKIMLTNFFTGKLNLCHTEKMEVHCQKTNQEVRHLVSDVQEGLERKIERNTEEVKQVNNHCEQVEINIKELFEVSDNLSEQIKSINENIRQLSEDMKTQENALKHDLEVISKKEENPYESYMIRAPEIPGLKAVLNTQDYLNAAPVIPGLGEIVSEAVKTGNWAKCKKFLLQYLQKESDLYKQLINVREDGFLRSAAEHGLTELFTILYRNNDSMNSVIERQLVCHVAVKCGHKKLLEFLLSQGLSIETQITPSPSWTLLHEAASKGYVQIAELLLQKGCDKEARAKFGRTPLHVAATYGQKPMIQLLINYGCDTSARDRCERTAYDLFEYKDDPIAYLLKTH